MLLLASPAGFTNFASHESLLGTQSIRSTGLKRKKLCFHFLTIFKNFGGGGSIFRCQTIDRREWGGEKKNRDTKFVRKVCILHDGEGGPNSGQENPPVTFDEKIREID
jgi:hypothetical protein